MFIFIGWETFIRSLPVGESHVADNNVRYMALQALSVLAQLDIQVQTYVLAQF